MQSLGLEVETFQENEPHIFNKVCYNAVPDLIIWTRTKWNPDTPRHEAMDMLQRASRCIVPVVGIHLDRWWGLNREHELDTEPYFRVDTLYTADGGPHDWESKHINHRWLPPAVDADSCVRGTYREELASEVAFVGSWQGGYHPEHSHRHELVAWLKETYGDRCVFWPKLGEHALRGKDLQDLYASVDVVVGDSCFTGTDHYWSDRIPETLGRGGYLVHPRVEGLSDFFEHGRDLYTWEPGSWDELAMRIQNGLDWGPDHRRQISDHGQSTVLAGHTYQDRIVRVLTEQGIYAQEADEDAHLGEYGAEEYLPHHDGDVIPSPEYL